MQFSKRLLTLVTALSFIVMAAGQSIASAQTQSAAPTGTFEFMSWWTGGEAPALKALTDLYSKKYPNVKLVNSGIAGGSGVAAQAVLKTRLLGGNPPDTFQVHAGQELIGTWVVANRMLPLDDLFASQGFNDKFPKGLLDLLSYNGHVWSVPVNIHRANVLWYVPANLKKWGVDVPKTWDDFFAACTKLKAAGVSALALGPNWTQVHLFETILLATLGPDDYVKIWKGGVDWTSDKVKAAFTTYGKVLDCANKDYDSLTDWIPAAELVVQGKAAFQVMGDWEDGWLRAVKNLTPNKDYGWAPAPGTAGSFDMLADSFGLPKSIKNSDATIAWLDLIGSVEGQNAFNPLKGSIPARTDADVKNAKGADGKPLYSVYSQSAADDWASNKIVPSLWHGAAAPDSFKNDFATVISVFNAQRDADAAGAAAQGLAVLSGMAKGS